MSVRVALVPGVLALLPQYASLDDPVGELRAACLAAVAWLGREVTVLADPQGARVAAYLLGQRGEHSDTTASYLVVGNGTATRSATAPGASDPWALGYDAELRGWLVGDGPLPDPELGCELWATEGLVEMDRLLTDGLLTDRGASEVHYDDDPFGVAYWVMRWTCES